MQLFHFTLKSSRRNISTLECCSTITGLVEKGFDLNQQFCPILDKYKQCLLILNFPINI